MGNIESEPESQRTIMIDEWEVPEAYKSMGVSEEVVNFVLSREQEELTKCLEDDKSIICLEHNNLVVSNDQPSQVDEEEYSEDNEPIIVNVQPPKIDHRKCIDEYCSKVLKDLTKCLKTNKASILNCQPFQFDYGRCIDEYRAKVLKEASEVEEMQPQ
ncbi:hypothetical protein M3Y97_00145200 [Aphelenchoides bicaudatus]|nr:hypothetical protein M3Y97_00145200 [Aphelenchoides bicaudatus]